MTTGGNTSNYILAAGTLLAAIFVAVQAWYARTSFLEGEATRVLERKLDLCFDNFDQAAALDSVLRQTVPNMEMQDVWPPMVVIETPSQLWVLRDAVVPELDALEAGLTKASVLGGLDKYRGYLAQQLRGLSKQLTDISPMRFDPTDEENAEVFARLSDFLGAQYSVFTGCRLLAEGQF
ncbi:MAG: hypothetical protein AAF667_11480 [Pseudomonadota bacterium]